MNSRSSAQFFHIQAARTHLHQPVSISPTSPAISKNYLEGAVASASSAIFIDISVDNRSLRNPATVPYCTLHESEEGGSFEKNRFSTLLKRLKTKGMYTRRMFHSLAFVGIAWNRTWVVKTLTLAKI